MIKKYVIFTALALASVTLPSKAAIVATWDVAAALSGSISDPVDIAFSGSGSGGTATLDDIGIFSLVGLDNITLALDGGFLGGATLDLAASGGVSGTYNPITQQLSNNLAVLNVSENQACSPSGLFGSAICDAVPATIDFSQPFELSAVDGLADPITFDLVNDFDFLLGDLGGVASLQLFLTDVQVSEVPIPAAAWMFGSALLGLGAVKRRKVQS